MTHEIDPNLDPNATYTYKSKDRLYKRSAKTFLAAGIAAVAAACGTTSSPNRANAATQPNKRATVSQKAEARDASIGEQRRYSQEMLNEMNKHPEVLNLAIIMPTDPINVQSRFWAGPKLSFRPLWANHELDMATNQGRVIQTRRIITFPRLFHDKKTGIDWLAFNDWNDTPVGPYSSNPDPLYADAYANNFIRWMPANLKYFPKGTILVNEPQLSAGVKKHVLNGKIVHYKDPFDPLPDPPNAYVHVDKIPDDYIGLMQGITKANEQNGLKYGQYVKLRNQNIENFIHS